MRKILAQTYALRQGAFGHVVVQELADDLVTHSHPQTQFSFWLGGGRCEAHLGNVLVKYGEHVALGIESPRILRRPVGLSHSVVAV